MVRALDSQPKGCWFKSHHNYWWLTFLSFLHLFGVHYHHDMSPVHTSPPSWNGYLAFAGVKIQLTALMCQVET